MTGTCAGRVSIFRLVGLSRNNYDPNRSEEVDLVPLCCRNYDQLLISLADTSIPRDLYGVSSSAFVDSIIHEYASPLI